MRLEGVGESPMYQKILEYLYQKYFLKNFSPTEVTSSHWKTIGGHDVKWDNGAFILKGQGFGVFRTDSFTNRALSFSEEILSRYLLRKFNCPTTLASSGRKIANQQGRVFVFDCAKQLLSIASILESLPKGASQNDLGLCARGIKVVCVIGDGYGYATSLVRQLDPQTKILCINLGKTLMFDVYYTQKSLPNARVAIIRKEGEGEKLINDNDIVFMEAENYHLLMDLPIDLFINIASMQEMNQKTIDLYFSHMRSSTSDRILFYCCNRLEKRLPDGEISIFNQYPWRNEDKILLDEICPWYKKFPISRPPFWRTPDGPHQHRLAILQKETH